MGKTAAGLLAAACRHRAGRAARHAACWRSTSRQVRAQRAKPPAFRGAFACSDHGFNSQFCLCSVSEGRLALDGGKDASHTSLFNDQIEQGEGGGMQLKSILNHVGKNKSFVYGTPRWSEDGRSIEVPIEPRKNSGAVCSGCHQQRPGYDVLKARRFQYVPLWGIAVYFIYCMRRVNCVVCGIVVEETPWSMGKSPLTRTFSLFLSAWAKRMSWKEVADIFGTSWNKVRDAVSWVVDYGLAHRDLSGVTAIGVDEMQIGKGQTYVTLVYQINEGCRRLLYVAKERTEKSLQQFFIDRGNEWSRGIKYVCSDMWKPYLNVIKANCQNALNILDRYHLVANLNRALDKVRSAEAKHLVNSGFINVLKKSRFCFLKNRENLTDNQRTRLKDVLKYDLKSVRGYLLKESFQLFWTYKTVKWAKWYMRKWCTSAMRSRLDPIKKFAKSIRRHEEQILNWFRAKKEFSSGVVEGLNRKANLITRKSYGFRTYDTLQLVLFHNLGALPEPEITHKFW